MFWCAICAGFAHVIGMLKVFNLILSSVSSRILFCYTDAHAYTQNTRMYVLACIHVDALMHHTISFETMLVMQSFYLKFVVEHNFGMTGTQTHLLLYTVVVIWTFIYLHCATEVLHDRKRQG